MFQASEAAKVKRQWRVDQAGNCWGAVIPPLLLPKEPILEGNHRVHRIVVFQVFRAMLLLSGLPKRGAIIAPLQPE